MNKPRHWYILIVHYYLPATALLFLSALSIPSFSSPIDDTDQIDSLKAVVQEKDFKDSHEDRLDLFSLLINHSRKEEARELIYSSLAQSRKGDDFTAIAQYRVLASVSERFDLNFDSAYSLLFSCLEDLQEIEHRDSILQQVYNLFGVFLYDRGQTMDAMLYFKKAAMICEESNPSKDFLKHVYNNLAVMSFNFERNEEAIEYCRKARKINKGDDRNLAAMIDYNMALALWDNGDHDSAIFYHEKTLARSEKDASGLRMYFLFGYLKAAIEGNLSNADTLYQQLYEVLSDKDELALQRSQSLLIMGNYHKSRDQFDSARYYYQLSYLEGGKHELLHRQIEAAEVLSKYYKKSGNKDSALFYLNQCHVLTDSMHSESDHRQLLEMERNLSIWEIDRVVNSGITRLDREKSRKQLFQFISGAMLIIMVLLFLLVRRKQEENRTLYKRAVLLSERGFVNKPLEDSNGLEIVENDPINGNGESEEELSKLTKDKIRKGLYKQLVQAQLFLDPNCNVSLLSSAINTNRTYLSQYVKSQYGTTVSEHVNDLRIFYVLEQLKVDASRRKYTIDRIASESGFNSKRTFERAFKARTGITPAFYIRQLEMDKDNLEPH